MDSGSLHAAAALDVLSRMHDVRAQNIANADTTGYPRRVATADAFSNSLRKASGMTLPDLAEDVDFTQGELKSTDSPNDLAISGPAFFALETAQGTRYTRNGAFNTNAEGFLVSADGARVLGQGGPIQVDPTQGPISVQASGAIIQNNAEVGRLKLVEFGNVRKLIADRDGRFREDSGSEPRDAGTSTVQQGYLERANVNVIDEMVQMIAGFRAFEAAQKALSSIDRIRQEATNPRA